MVETVDDQGCFQRMPVRSTGGLHLGKGSFDGGAAAHEFFSGNVESGRWFGGTSEQGVFDQNLGADGDKSKPPHQFGPAAEHRTRGASQHDAAEAHHEGDDAD